MLLYIKLLNNTTSN